MYVWLTCRRQMNEFLEKIYLNQKSEQNKTSIFNQKQRLLLLYMTLYQSINDRYIWQKTAESYVSVWFIEAITIFVWSYQFSITYTDLIDWSGVYVLYFVYCVWLIHFDSYACTHTHHYDVIVSEMCVCVCTNHLSQIITWWWCVIFQ